MRSAARAGLAVLFVLLLAAAAAVPAAAETEPTWPVDQIADTVYTYPHEKETALVCDGTLRDTSTFERFGFGVDTAGTINEITVGVQRWEVDWAKMFIAGPGQFTTPSEHSRTKLIVWSEGHFDQRGTFRGELEWTVLFNRWNVPAGAGNGFIEIVQSDQYRMQERPGMWAFGVLSIGNESAVKTTALCVVDVVLPATPLAAAAQGDSFVPMLTWLIPSS